MKKALIIVAIIALTAIAGSMIYYFVFFRTEIERAGVRLQEQKLTEEATRKENLKKCLKDAEDWHNKALDSIGNGTLEQQKVIIQLIESMYQNKINSCEIMYGN